VLNSCIGVSNYNEPYLLRQPFLPLPESTLGLTRPNPAISDPVTPGRGSLIDEFIRLPYEPIVRHRRLHHTGHFTLLTYS
jgi:hypothetical protein